MPGRQKTSNLWLAAAILALLRGEQVRGAELSSVLPAPAIQSSTSQPAAEQRYFGAFVREIAGLKDPLAVVIDRDNVIYIANAGEHRVRAFREDGTPVREWGGYGSGDGQFIWPCALALGLDEKLYVVDQGNHRIQVFERDGKFVRSFGGFGRDAGQLNQPAGVAIDLAGNVYVADRGNVRVQVFDAAGKAIRSIGGERSGSLEGFHPIDVATEVAGNLYVADADAHRIFKFDSSGRPLGVFGDWGNSPGLFNQPGGIVLQRATQRGSFSPEITAASQPIDANPGGVDSPRLYVTDRVNHRVQVLTLDGKPLYQWGLHALRPREGGGRLHYPSRTAIAPSGLFAVVCEPMEDRVQVFGLRDSPIDPAALLIPPGDNLTSHYGYHVDVAGTLLAIAEQDGGSGLIFDIRGKEPIELNRFGGYGSGNGQFLRPGDLSLDASGRRLIVSDPVRERLSIFRIQHDPAAPVKMLPEMTTFVKSVRLECPDSPDGRHVRASALTQDSKGNLYVLDDVKCAVLVFDAEMRFVRRFGEYGTGPGKLMRPTDLALNPAKDALYVVDSFARRLKSFDLDGHEKEAPGEPSISWDLPFGVAVDKRGRIFVTDCGANRVVRLDPGGTPPLEWGRKGLNAGEFVKPRGIAIDGQGREFVVDHGNHRTQIFDADGRFLEAFGARLFVVPARKSAAVQPPATRPVASAPSSASASSASGELLSNDRKFTVHYRTKPSPIPLNEPFVIEFTIAESGKSAADVDVKVDAAMPEHGHGMNVQPKLDRNADGSYTARGLLFHMPGRWELYFDITRAGVTERAQAVVELE